MMQFSGVQVPEIILFHKKAEEKLQEIAQKNSKGIKTVHLIKLKRLLMDSFELTNIYA
jgi:hypothetical protein